MLIDTNVLIASAIEHHIHHLPSLRLLETAVGAAISAHSLSEFMNITTRVKGYGWKGSVASAKIAEFARRFEVDTLSAADWVEAVRSFGIAGRRGPLIYDWLIGQVGLRRGVSVIATWNVRDMALLFPTLRVATPAELLETP